MVDDQSRLCPGWHDGILFRLAGGIDTCYPQLLYHLHDLRITIAAGEGRNKKTKGRRTSCSLDRRLENHNIFLLNLFRFSKHCKHKSLGCGCLKLEIFRTVHSVVARNTLLISLDRSVIVPTFMVRAAFI